jgi:phage repressor protein C with HTH and peptisase S24 domain
MAVGSDANRQKTIGLAVEKIIQPGYFSHPLASVFGRNLRRLQRERGLQNGELAEILGVTASMVSRWKHQDVEPESPTVLNVAAKLGVSTDDLLREHEITSDVEVFDRDIRRGYKKNDIPVVGDVEADSDGAIAWDEQGMPKTQAEEFVSRAFGEGDPRAIAFRVRNDSMIPRYSPGEVIVVQPRLSVRDGDYAVIVLVSGQRLLKKVVRVNGGWILRSLNSAYPDRPVNEGEVAGMYLVKHHITP